MPRPKRKKAPTTGSIDWADDVMWVYQRIHELLDYSDPETTGPRRSLHDWAYEEENKKEFLKNIVPKASDIIEKRRKDSPDDLAIQLAERKSMAELMNLIAETVDSARANPPLKTPSQSK